MKRSRLIKVGLAVGVVLAAASGIGYWDYNSQMERLAALTNKCDLEEKELDGLIAKMKGSWKNALEDVRRQGPTNVIIHSVKPVDDTSGKKRGSWVAVYGLTWDDYERCSPRQLDTVVGQVPMRIFPQEIRHLGRVCNARVVATTEAYAKIHRSEMAAGRFLVDGKDQKEEGDNQRFRNVVVLGARVAEDLFPFEQPVGQSVVINKDQYKVIGVIKDRTPRGASSSGGTEEDYNKDVYIPIETCKVGFGAKIFTIQGSSRSAEQVQLHQITLTVRDLEHVRTTGDVVTNLLKRYHTKKDWKVSVPLDRLEQAEREQADFVERIARHRKIIAGIRQDTVDLPTRWVSAPQREALLQRLHKLDTAAKQASQPIFPNP
jgi:putative ABC transport system permease protein